MRVPHRLHWLAVVLLAACHREVPRHDASTDAPFDAGPADAGPPSCLRAVEPGEPFGDLLGDCGICLEPYARYVNPYGIAPGRDTFAAAVPGGVVILMGSYSVLVTEAGEVIPNPELPLLPEPDTTLYVRLRQMTVVPEAGRLWLTTHWLRGFDPSVGATHAVLYEVDEVGWRRIAAHRVDTYLYPVFASGEGDLLSDAPLDGGSAVIRLHPREDGTVDELRQSVQLLDVPDVPYGNITEGWGLPDGNAAFVWNVNDGPTSTDYLVVVTPDLELARPVEQISGDRWRYEPRNEPRVYAASQRRDGSVTLVLAGAPSGLDAANNSHYWLLRIDGDGSLRDTAPGVLLNEDLFIMREDAHTYWQSSNPILFPRDNVGLVWQYNHEMFGMVHDIGQVINTAGLRSFGPPLAFSEITPYSWPRWVHDGGDRPYIGRAEFRYPDSSRDRAYSVYTIDEAFTDRWHVYVQGCEERTGEANITTAGAWEDGVWVIWADELRDMNGHRHLVTKATLIRSDGSFAWGE